MSISKELGESASRLRSYVDRLVQLLRKHEVRSIRTLTEAVRSNQEFSAEWRTIWRELASADGGKLSLSTAGTVLGAVLGGVGIAAMGGAFGLPLALVLGLGGLIAGAELDAVRATSRSKLKLIKLPATLHARIQLAAKTSGLSTSALILSTLAAAFPEPDAIEHLIDPAG